MNVFETERLAVRRLRPEDLDQLAEIAGDAEVMRYVGDGRPIEREQARQWIENSLANYAGRGFGSFAVVEKGNEGRLIGYCGLVNPSAEGEAEIIYGFAKPYWGRGLASELTGPLLAFGLGPCGLKRIVATIYPENTPSIRVVEKWGMKFVERRLDDGGEEEVVYRIERPENACEII